MRDIGEAPYELRSEVEIGAVDGLGKGAVGHLGRRGLASGRRPAACIRRRSVRRRPGRIVGLLARRLPGLGEKRRDLQSPHAEPVDLRLARYVEAAGLLLVAGLLAVEKAAAMGGERRLLPIAQLVGQDRLAVVDEHVLPAGAKAAHVLLGKDVLLLFAAIDRAMAAHAKPS